MKRVIKLVFSILALGLAVIACGGGGGAGASPDKLTVVGSGS